ncbi:hypothetical protein MJO10_30470, partial [Salmonella enterica subsp. enterica serovar Anatum]|nr:hypothetical protein [Salmonella enterica subsp. enterica serovar Anatum]
VVNEKLVVVPNTHYWDNAKTVLQKVTFLPINQESAATKRYLAILPDCHTSLLRYPLLSPLYWQMVIRKNSFMVVNDLNGGLLSP